MKYEGVPGAINSILTKACEKIEPMNSEMCLSCHRRKLQILMAVSGMDASLASCKTFFQNSGLKTHSASDMVSTENSSKQWYHLVADEIKAILQCISQVKNFIDQSRDYVSYFLLLRINVFCETYLGVLPFCISICY